MARAIPRVCRRWEQDSNGSAPDLADEVVARGPERSIVADADKVTPARGHRFPRPGRVCAFAVEVIVVGRDVTPIRVGSDLSGLIYAIRSIRDIRGQAQLAVLTISPSPQRSILFQCQAMCKAPETVLAELENSAARSDGFPVSIIPDLKRQHHRQCIREAQAHSFPSVRSAKVSTQPAETDSQIVFVPT